MLDTFNLRKFNELIQIYFDQNTRLRDTVNAENKFCEFLFITGPVHPYYKYFLAASNDYKDNTVMLCEAVRDKRYLMATSTFIVYNLAKTLLWKYGYFAHFFFNTRMLSVAIYLMSLKFIQQRFKNDLRNSELWRYYNKRKRTQAIETEVRKKMVLEMMIRDRL
jgi:hypothetical protein